MGIEDEIGAEFGHLHISAQVSLDMVAAAEKDLEAVPLDLVTAFCAKVGVEIKSKREGAYIVAAIREAVKVGGPFVSILLGL